MKGVHHYWDPTRLPTNVAILFSSEANWDSIQKKFKDAIQRGYPFDVVFKGSLPMARLRMDVLSAHPDHINYTQVPDSLSPLKLEC